MGKYASWSELATSVPKAYEDNATKESFLRGLNGIAPPGMKAKPERGEHYGSGVVGKGPKVVDGFKRAMFV
jgi:hypothetical protein